MGKCIHIPRLYNNKNHAGSALCAGKALVGDKIERKRMVGEKDKEAEIRAYEMYKDGGREREREREKWRKGVRETDGAQRERNVEY